MVAYPNDTFLVTRKGLTRTMVLTSPVDVLFFLVPYLVTGSLTSDFLPGTPWWTYYALIAGIFALSAVMVVKVYPEMYSKRSAETVEVEADHLSLLMPRWTRDARGEWQRTVEPVRVDFSQIRELGRARDPMPRLWWRPAPSDPSVPTRGAAKVGFTILTRENVMRVRTAYDAWKAASAPVK